MFFSIHPCLRKIGINIAREPRQRACAFRASAGCSENFSILDLVNWISIIFLPEACFFPMPADGT
jgi:hypothetical protein